MKDDGSLCSVSRSLASKSQFWKKHQVQRQDAVNVDQPGAVIT